MNFNKIQKLAAKAADAHEQLDRMITLFNYATVDETSDREDSPRFACIKIGGAGTHASIYALTRAEINLLEPVLRRILEARHQAAKAEMLREAGVS